jgi:hypothetical protein
MVSVYRVTRTQMTILSIKRSQWLRSAVIAPALLCLGGSCTNLTEVPHDALTTETAFRSNAEILAGVAGVYSALRAVEWVGYETLQDLTTDVSIVPTRGSDWYDNGQWLDLHRQTWTANSAGTLAFVNGAWNDMFGAVAKENLMIDVIAKAGSGAKGDTTLAELRTLRAWDYYMLMDMFGGVPLVTTTELKQYPRVGRDSVFRFIESELLAARDKLPVKWDPQYYGRVTKGAANAILASLYINAGVFSKNSGVSTTAYNSCAGVQVSGGKPACQAALDAANAVISSGAYTLSSNWFQNFSLTNKSSTENIFVIVHVSDQGLGMSWPMRTLHYNQLSTGQGGPWNGFATTAETFAKFAASDNRRGMWLFGQATSFENGQAVNDRTGRPLVFTSAIADANSASESEGVRFNKFVPLPSAPTGAGATNDFPFFRLSEMYLIKAEAENELNQTTAAVADLALIHDSHDKTNTVARMGLTTQAGIRDAIMNERLLEFAAEGKRRSDMIRAGKFLSWTEASRNGVSSTPRNARFIVFPIPAPQLASNPLLTQNSGY